MSRFAIRTPYFILVACLVILVLGVNALTRMPVDLFPPIEIPVVVVATFYSGMPPEQIETDITSRFERFFTLAGGIDRIESRSLPGVSVIKVIFQPGANPDTAVTSIGNLAMANLRRLPPGTLPPVVLKFDASSLPVCLVTLKGEGLNETTLRDLAQFNLRNQVASVPGASVPQPFGGVMRQIMVYADPYKLEALQLSPMDLVRSISQGNLILPAGDVPIGNLDYNIYTNSQLTTIEEIDRLPIKMDGLTPVRVADVGHAEDSHQIQTNVVRIDGQRSVYLPILKQGGDTNTIAVVDGMREALSQLVDLPKELVTKVVFDQSKFVKTAIETLLHEGAIGLFLTSLMILVFLGSMRATVAVFFSIPLSALTTFLILAFGGGTLNSMVLGGLALAFSRLIDNSVVVLENIYRHLELGESPAEAAEKGGREVALPVLAATLTTAVVFFPVTLLYGVSRYLFTALASAVVISLFASYVVALTVVPLFCARFVTSAPHGQVGGRKSWGGRFQQAFNHGFERFLRLYDGAVHAVLGRPVRLLSGFSALFVATLAVFPFVGLAFFPRTDPGQFVMNLKLPSGTRIQRTEQAIEAVERLVRRIVPPDELGEIVSNIGLEQGFSAMYSPNSGSHTAFVQVSLKEDHKRSSFEYMDEARRALLREMPEVDSYFQAGGLMDAVLNLGMPAPIDVQVSGSNLKASYRLASDLAEQIRALPGISGVYVPQDIDYPAIQLDIDRTRASQLGLDQREVVNNVLTSLTSSGMVAPTFWIDPKTGLDYLLTVQYPENQIRSFGDLSAIPLRGSHSAASARLDAVGTTRHVMSPTEVDHYQLRRVIDIFVRPSGEALGTTARAIDRIVERTKLPAGLAVQLRGSVVGMWASFRSFSVGLILSVILLYLILVAQFRSFSDPLIILMAVPPAISGVIVTLAVTGTTLNVMSLMGIVMLVGIAVSNSILIVEFTRQLRSEGIQVRTAVARACRVRLRPVLMTSLATIFGLLPMALKLGAGSEAYAPLARAIIGGLTCSVAWTVFLVPAAYFLWHRRFEVNSSTATQPEEGTHA